MAEYIFVVDDSMTTRASIEFVLKQAGYNVSQGVDGADALERLNWHRSAGHHISLIIADVNMPRMDGIRFTRELKKTALYKTPVLILTTESQNSKKQQGRQAGAAGWLVKPFQPDQLLEVVRKLTQ